ncbi:MAG: molybdopterin-binding protein [Solirubrobacteraceae bacterium]|nr:molybdopterin-binding protein [Solirubrobacteraceae bacterium]
MTISAVIVIAHDNHNPQVSVEEYGPEVAARVEAIGGDVLAIELVPLGGELFEERLQHYIDEGVSLLLTCGGSSIGPDDIVPELTSIIVERRVPGLEELVRRALAEEGAEGTLERGACGIAGETLVLNLPRSVAMIEAALAALAPVLPSVQAQLSGRSTGLDPRDERLGHGDDDEEYIAGDDADFPDEEE